MLGTYTQFSIANLAVVEYFRGILLFSAPALMVEPTSGAELIIYDFVYQP